MGIYSKIKEQVIICYCMQTTARFGSTKVSDEGSGTYGKGKEKTIKGYIIAALLG
jgi:hypothetical protein